MPYHTFDGIPRVSFAEGTIVLGVPIGSDDFTAKFIDDVCAKLAHLANRIGLLKSAIAKFLLLRACFGACRINHLLRSLPFEHGSLLEAYSRKRPRSLFVTHWAAFSGAVLPLAHWTIPCISKTVRSAVLCVSINECNTPSLQLFVSAASLHAFFCATAPILSCCVGMIFECRGASQKKTQLPSNTATPVKSPTLFE